MGKTSLNLWAVAKAVTRAKLQQCRPQQTRKISNKHPKLIPKELK